MVELLVLGALVFAALFVVGVLGSILALVFWLITLPFKLLGFAFKGLAFLLLLPFLAVAALVAFLVFGIGMVAALLPALPFVLLVAALIWLLRRRGHVPAAGRP